MSSTNDASHSNYTGPRFGLGDFLSIAGFMLFLCCFIYTTSAAGDAGVFRMGQSTAPIWTYVGTGLCFVAMLVAFVASYLNLQCLCVLDAWCILTFLTTGFGVLPMGPARETGAGFFFILSAVVVGLGSYARRHELFQFRRRVIVSDRDVETRLLRIKEMFDKGVLTTDEYGVRRRELLDQLK